MRKFVISFNIIISILLGLNFIMLIVYCCISHTPSDGSCEYKSLYDPITLIAKNNDTTLCIEDSAGIVNKIHYIRYSITLKDRLGHFYSKSIRINDFQNLNEEQAFIRNVCDKYNIKDVIK